MKITVDKLKGEVITAKNFKNENNVLINELNKTKELLRISNENNLRKKDEILKEEVNER